MKRENICLWTGGGFEVLGDRIWFVPYWVNVLCCFNRKSGQMEKMVHFPGLTTASAGFNNVKRVENRLMIIPAFEHALYVYDMDTGEIRTTGPELKHCALEKFQECAEWNGYLYVFPFGYDAVIRLGITDPGVTFLPLRHVNGQFCDSCQIHGTIYLVNRTNQLAAFDGETGRFRIYQADGEKCLRTVTRADADTLLLTDENSEMYLFHIRTSRFEKMAFTGIPANQSLVLADHIYLFPLRDGYGITRSSMDGTGVCRYEMHETSRYQKWSSVAASKIRVDGSRVSFMNPNHQCLYEFDSRTGRLDSCYCMAEPWSEELCGYFFGLSGTGGIRKEGKERFASLEYFMDRAGTAGQDRDDSGRHTDKTEMESVGETVYRLMCE